MDKRKTQTRDYPRIKPKNFLQKSCRSIPPKQLKGTNGSPENHHSERYSTAIDCRVRKEENQKMHLITICEKMHLKKEMNNVCQEPLTIR